MLYAVEASLSFTGDLLDDIRLSTVNSSLFLSITILQLGLLIHNPQPEDRETKSLAQNIQQSSKLH